MTESDWFEFTNLNLLFQEINLEITDYFKEIDTGAEKYWHL